MKNVAECREGRIHIGRPLKISKLIKKVIKNQFFKQCTIDYFMCSVQSIGRKVKTGIRLYTAEAHTHLR